MKNIPNNGNERRDEIFIMHSIFNAITRHALSLCTFMSDELTNRIAAPQRVEELNVSLTMVGGLAVTLSFTVS